MRIEDALNRVADKVSETFVSLGYSLAPVVIGTPIDRVPPGAVDWTAYAWTISSIPTDIRAGETASDTLIAVQMFRARGSEPGVEQEAIAIWERLQDLLYVPADDDILLANEFRFAADDDASLDGERGWRLMVGYETTRDNVGG